MPPRLPDRYSLNVRLGRDRDIEEWLATDEQLDRPVLIRFLPPDASPERIEAFLAPVRAAAATTHQHVQKVYAAGSDADGTYAVCEWDGAVSISDRLAAGETLPVEEFLPNAAGLADGLATFHAAGGVHGGIDASTIHFSRAHPAKLGGFGRTAEPRDTDTMDLARVLREAVTGTPEASVRPSHVVEGLPVALDDVLDRAERGELDAAELAAAIRAIPFTAGQDRDRSTGIVRWSVAFAFVAVTIIATAAAGLAIGDRSNAPFLYPVEAEPTPTPSVPADIGGVEVVERVTLPARPSVYDPLGDGTELDDLVGNIVDGDPDTVWTTESYSRPLREIKDGVGLVFEVDGIPSRLLVTGVGGTAYRLGWSDDPPDDPEAWENVATGILLPGTTAIGLPSREGGAWLLWFRDLPPDDRGGFSTTIAEARFLD